jgi:hypothetical protein
VTHERRFEQRLADWLEDGPYEAPDRVVDSAGAFARAHPRRRSLLGGLWRTVMTHLQPAQFPSSAHRARVTAFATISVIAVVALAVVGGGALLLNRGPASEPAVAPAITQAPTSAPMPTTSTSMPTPAPSPSPAANPDEGLVADLAAVMSNPYDATRVAALYAPNAVIHETTADQTQTGLEAIGARIRYLNDQKFKAIVTSAVIRQGDFVAAFNKYGAADDPSSSALVVYELKDGKVQNQWVYPAP